VKRYSAELSALVHRPEGWYLPVLASLRLNLFTGVLCLAFITLSPNFLSAQDDPDVEIIDLEDEVDVEEMMEEEEDWEFEEFSIDDEFLFDSEEAGDKELMFGPVRLQKVAGRDGVYVFDIKEKMRAEVVIVDMQMKVITTLLYPDGKGEINIYNLPPGEYFLRFSWPSGEVIEKVYRLEKRSPG
jgi:hypothetical protein